MLEALLMEPMFYAGIGGFAALIAIFIWRYQYPDEYKRAKKKVVNFLCTAHHVFYFLASMISLSALGCVAIYFYSEKTVDAIRAGAPDVYAFIAGYILSVQVAFLIFISLFFLWKTMTHYHNSLDNGVIDDPDVERRFTRTDIVLDQMERNRKKDMAQMQKAIEAITQMQQAFYSNGNRFEKDPTPPEGVDERRTIVRKDPSVPITKEEIIEAVLPTLVEEKTTEIILPDQTVVVSEVLGQTEETLPVIVQEEPIKEQDKPKKLSWLHSSDWDELIWGKKAVNKK
ncbi:MAG: hypothetical protein NTZ13_04640 [Candidatus Parcubacteria bacterium]|nr:hypothetical protein [Candidatus Parcubacteria bacterium]